MKRSDISNSPLVRSSKGHTGDCEEFNQIPALVTRYGFGV